MVLGKEGWNVTLSCNYSSTYTSNYLYWYCHYLGTSTQYILHKANLGNFASSATFANGKFSCKVTTNSAHLYISNVKTEDSASYVCALQAAQCDTEQLRSDINLTLSICTMDEENIIQLISHCFRMGKQQRNQLIVH
uniref:Ig-like domain-containing protein n=1 Tax=Pyxicephalus adspersus TaxID=30357 RepID=A0AAV3AES2_PYXAD|nr:TPA: hypothetical protein GDO54_013666 [Pyxicephalus adspersus]